MPFMIHLATKEAVVSASVMLHKFLNAGPQLLKWLQRVSGTAIYHPDNYAECGHSRGQRRREIAADRKRARPIAFAPPPQCESDNKADWQEGKRRQLSRNRESGSRAEYGRSGRNWVFQPSHEREQSSDECCRYWDICSSETGVRK